MRQIRAIIADDEEALRSFLKKKLLAVWPDVLVCGEAQDGNEALRLIDAEHPDVAFLDVKMPGLSGIEVAQKTGWKCPIVFITAHDKYAVEAFENEAVDYILKPVSQDRLERTVKRLKERLAASSPLPDLSAVLEKVSQTLKQPSSYLQWVKAQHKDGIRLIPTADIYYFKSTDKYTTVRTREVEFLIHKTIKELEEELDPELFWRVHRAAIVNVKSIHTVKRSVAGTYSIRFQDIQDSVIVSRAFGHLFKQM
jgi:DNA-binding LytR/AlgR family response regulator